jgi:methyl-accepting chemotaxis protein
MKEKLEFKILGTGMVVLVAAVVLINIFVLRIEKADIYSLSTDRLAATAKVVTKGIEDTMVEGNPEITRNFIRDLSSIGGFEAIEVFNREGRTAFVAGSPVVEADVLDSIAESGEHLTFMQKDSIVYYMPLPNIPTCHACHLSDGKMLGAVKLSISLENEYNKITDFILFMTAGSLLGLGVLGFVFWQILRGFVITPVQKLESSALRMAEGDLSFRTDIGSRDEIGRLEGSIKESLSSISGILKRVREVSGRIADAADSVEEESADVVKGTQLEAEAISEISSSMEQLNTSITEISVNSEGLAESAEETAVAIEEMTSTTGSLTKVTREVSEGVDATSSSIEELSATIKEVAGNAGELEKVSGSSLSAMDEIIASVKRVESMAKESSELSEKVKEDASTVGVNSIDKTMQGMEKIRASVSKTSEVVEKLVSRSEEIGSVINVIDEITDQTTLLALNAAILAAQAGEHGKGFSVVANEIKDLAERTDFSTKEINQLIQSIRKEVRDAVVAMEEGMASVEEGTLLAKESSSALRMILDSATKSSEMAVSIERTTAEQARSARYVSESVERVRGMVEQIARATAEQSRGAALIIEAAAKMRDASHQADKATEQQAVGSRQISKSIENISERSRHISRAINEQEMGTKQIWSSLEKIKSVPEKNRNLAFSINRELRALAKDSEIVNMEMERFTLFEDVTEGVITVGVVPFVSPSGLFRKLLPLISYLGREAGRRFELRVAKDFRAAVDDLKNGITQLCIMTSIIYVEASREKELKILAGVLRKGKPSHSSAIITGPGSGIGSLSDLRGRSFAFVDKYSASGYLVPRAMLLEEGIGLDALSSYNFLGYHDDVIEAVLKGEFSAGGVLESSAVKFQQRGVRILKSSPDIPEFNVCAGDLDAEVMAAVKSALLKLTDHNPLTATLLGPVDEEYTGFRESRDEDYDGIRAMFAKEEAS